MKKSLFFLSSLFAALAFTACSNNDEPTPAPDTENTGYVAVTIVQPKSAASRDGATGDFVNGSAEENNASVGLFFILGNDKEKVESAQRVNLTGTGSTGTPAVERIYNAMLLINGDKTKPTTPKYIVCILNAPAGLEEGVTKLSQLQAKVADYCTGKTSDGTFVMSNSVYYDKEDAASTDATKLIIGAEITDANICTSAADALAHPVEIYVERVVAKVRTVKGDTFTGEGKAEVTVDGEPKKYNIVIDGMALANLTNKAYLIKNIDGYTNTDWVWKDATNKRTYWEVMPDATTNSVGISKLSWNDIKKDTHFNKTTLEGTQYILPNTYADDPTALVVAAHLEDATGNKVQLVWLRGAYTTDEGARNAIADVIYSKYGYYKKTDATSFAALDKDDYEWVGITVTGSAFNCKAQLKATFGTDKKIYAYNGTVFNEVTDGVSDVNTYLSENSNNLLARMHKDGNSYYFVNIEHVAATTGADAKPAINGIVRNHIYQLTLNSIKGIGIPVFDPDEKDIPDDITEEDLYYLGAKVNVLGWRLVTQGVDFGKN